MASFVYTAMDARGKEQRGKIDAENQQDATTKLKQNGLFPTSVIEGKGGGGGKPGAAAAQAAAAKKAGGGLSALLMGQPVMKRKQLTQVTRQLATLIEAGLPLVRALRTLERQAKRDAVLRRIMGDIASSVEGGATFSEALAAHPKSFNKLYVNMIRAGEASGALSSVLARLAEFMEKAQRIAGKVKSAMVYPVIVLVIALTITSGLMIFIVPKFSKIFAEMLPGEDLPPLTQFVVGISNFMKDQFIVMFGSLGALVVAFNIAKKTSAGSYFIDFLAIKMPPFNQLAIRSSVARFCRTLGTLMQAGVAVLQALQIVKDTAGNELIARAVQTVHDAVKEGAGMSKPLEQTQVFPGMVVSMVEVGEETGALPEMLNRIADIYEEEVDRAVESLTSLIEPFMIVFLAVVVGGIVIALFMPLIKLIDKLGAS